METEYTAAERAAIADRLAARGAEMLDERGPAGWANMVDPATLKMWSPWSCILGQVFDPGDGDNGFGIGLRDLFGDDRYRMVNGETPTEVYGFNLPEAHALRGLDFVDLRDAWLRQVDART